MEKQVEVTIELEGLQEPAALKDSELADYSWYLGSNTTTDAALLLLKTCTITNCFAVYRKPNEEFMISIKISPTGMAQDVYEHLQISRSMAGQYTIHGPVSAKQLSLVVSSSNKSSPNKQKVLSSNNLVKLVDQYIHSFLPPLLPAVGTSVRTLSESDNGRPLSALASACSILTSSEEKKLLRLSYIASSTQQAGAQQPQWHNFQDKSKLHPQNVCFGCCYRRKEWNGNKYAPKRSWYDLRGNGPLRFLGLLMFWLSCGICYGSYCGLKYIFVFLTHVCCQIYDNEE